MATSATFCWTGHGKPDPPAPAILTHLPESAHAPGRRKGGDRRCALTATNTAQPGRSPYPLSNAAPPSGAPLETTDVELTLFTTYSVISAYCSQGAREPMATPVSSGVCPINNDDQFGPRVAIACRSFDFTLLFEDAFFVALPAALFLVLLPLRLQSLYKAPVKVTSYQLATWKLVTFPLYVPLFLSCLAEKASQSLIAVMLVSHLLFLVFRLGAPALHTRLAVSSGVLGAAATLAAGIRSFFEDQRSLKPSDLLVLYFSVSTVLYIPRLRTLWMMPSADLPKAMWTVVFVGTAVLVFVESAKKTRFLRPSYRSATTEQTTGFWSRSFFFWVLPFFRAGYAKVLQPDDIPRVDGDLEEHLAWSRLDSSWHKTSHGRHRLVRAAFRANIWAFLSAVPPRLALAAFSFSQPFLIEASVKYMNSTSEERENDNNYGQALVGAFILAYLGIAVGRSPMSSRHPSRPDTMLGITSGILASNLPTAGQDPVRSHCQRLPTYHIPPGHGRQGFGRHHANGD